MKKKMVGIAFAARSNYVSGIFAHVGNQTSYVHLG